MGLKQARLFSRNRGFVRTVDAKVAGPIPVRRSQGHAPRPGRRVLDNVDLNIHVDPNFRRPPRVNLGIGF